MTEIDLKRMQRRRQQRQRNRRWAGLLLVLLLLAVGGYVLWQKATPEEANGGTETAAQAAPAAEPAPHVSTHSDSTPPPAPEEKETTAAPRHTTGTGTYTIRIDKGAYRLYLLQDGQVVHSYPVAIGKNTGQKQRSGDLRTPTGVFSVDEILDASYWTHDFGDGKGEIEGAYGPFFISLDTNALSGGAWDGIGIHGTHDPSSIGTRASEGCVRMNNSDLLELKKYINVGTQVVIEE